MSMPLKNLSVDAFEESLREVGLPKFRSQQVLSWVYGKGCDSYKDMTNIPKAMREQLDESYPLYAANLVDKQVSVDGSSKYLLEFHDGARVETVGLPSKDGRLSVCVSCQSGCSMGCEFCATGKRGLTRSLFPGEIVDQIHAVQRDYSCSATNVVVMGQGEPFLNYDNTLAALRIINHPKLLNIGARHITVSTCGVIRGIKKFSNEPEQFTLTVSLHAARQEVRDKLMPSMKKQTIEDLKKTLQDYASKTKRRFSFEYALMKGINDREEDLYSLIEYCKGMLCHVNLIPLNEVEGFLYRPVSRKVMEQWQRELESYGVAASIRMSKGADIDAACGQLALKTRV